MRDATVAEERAEVRRGPIWTKDGVGFSKTVLGAGLIAAEVVAAAAAGAEVVIAALATVAAGVAGADGATPVIHQGVASMLSTLVWVLK